MVKRHSRKNDAKKRQAVTGESLQSAITEVDGSQIIWTPEYEVALDSIYGVPFRDGLSEAREAADKGDIETVEGFARKCLRLAPGAGIEVATVFWLYRDELDRANVRALPGLVRRILKDEEEALALRRPRPSGNPVLAYDGLRPPGVKRTAWPDLQLMDPRVGTLLNCLTTLERKVLLERSRPGTFSWTDAASIVGAPNPRRTGDQVRCKVQRLAAELWARSA
ncbi:hypothetical protein [Streptomyces griseorubiginosus]|uniref:hypothetical protein n=1 Tax=Streptomyces griseorubiginosus TaxID=67304 RepID=UPI0036A6BC12